MAWMGEIMYVDMDNRYDGICIPTNTYNEYLEAKLRRFARVNGGL